jgi:hypothetical protein
MAGARVRLGVCVGWDEDYDDGSGIAYRLANWSVVQRKHPYYYVDWLNPWRPPEAALLNYEGQDVITLSRELDMPLYLNFNLNPRAEETMDDVLAGRPTVSGLTDAEHVGHIARHLASYCAETGRVVPVRFLHEFNAYDQPWDARYFSAPSYRALFGRWARILKGADGRIKSTYCTASGAPLGRLLQAYYPGDEVVDYIAADIYPGNAPEATEREFANLDAAYSFAQSRGKPFAIPEFSRPRESPRDDPAHIDRLGRWMATHPGLKIACSFELRNRNGDWRIGDGFHPRIAGAWRSWATRDAFIGWS